jgi:uncharacterized protein YjeT (DUF2065 family)
VQFEWGDLAAAFALYLVIEGLMPFVSPRGAKQAMAMFQQLQDSHLRVIGLVSVLSGAALLWFVRH